MDPILHGAGGLVIALGVTVGYTPYLVTLGTLLVFGFWREWQQNHTFKMKLHTWLEAFSWPVGGAFGCWFGTMLRSSWFPNGNLVGWW